MIIDFEVAQGVDAQSFGEPGKRTFCLRVLGSASRSAFLWLEKEHLRALSLGLRHFLTQAGYRQAGPTPTIGDFPEVPEHDYQVGHLSIGFDPSRQMVVLQMDDQKDENTSLRVQFALDQCAALVVQIDAIIVAGRPICFLCGLPMDPVGHVCSRSNGHQQQPLPDPDSDSTIGNP